MAQSINNSVKSTNPLAGLLGLSPAPKAKPTTGNSFLQGYGTGNNFLASQSAPKPNMSTPNGPAVAPTAGLVKPATPSWQDSLKTTQDNFFNSNPSVPRTPAQPQVQNIAQAQPTQTVGAPVLGGANSGGTMNPNYNLQTNSPAPAATPGTRGLFPDVVSSLAARGNQTNPMTTESYGRAQELADQLKQSRMNQAGAEGTNRLNPIPIGDQTGREAVIRNQYLAEQNALTGQLTAEQQLANLGITQQSAQNSALSSAAGYAQPQVTSYGQTAFDPTTSIFSGGANGGLPAEVMQQYAQMAATGQYTAIPSFITSNPVLNAQLNVAAKSLNPNYTPIGAQGASGVLGNIPAMQSANTAAEGIKNTIQSYLQTNPQLNSTNAALVNQAQQWLQGKQLTDPKYQVLFNYLDEYTNTLAPILGVGGSPTNFKTQIAQGFVNAAASGQSISEVLNAMSTLATHKIQDLQSGAVGGGTTVPAPSTGGTGGFAETW